MPFHRCVNMNREKLSVSHQEPNGWNSGHQAALSWLRASALAQQSVNRSRLEGRGLRKAERDGSLFNFDNFNFLLYDDAFS
jgi:hypothetical protein